MINKQGVTKHFSRNVSTYDEYAVVQKLMASKLGALAQKQGDFKNILEIGCGTGFFTEILAKSFPQAKIRSTDISQEMLNFTQAKLSHYKNITYEQADGENYSSGEKFDLIISNAVFQWFNDYYHAFSKFKDLLTPEGCLVYATFGEDTFWELNNSFNLAKEELALTNTNSHGPAFISWQNLRKISNALNFSVSVTEEKVQEFFPNVKAFLSSVKKVGANNANNSNKVLVNRKFVLKMMEKYARNHGIIGKIPATYHIIYAVHKVRA